MIFHRGTHEMEMIREEHWHTGGQDEGHPGKKTIEVGGFVNIKITKSGDITYIAKSKTGTAQSDAKWQCKKIDQTDPNNILITWADGNPEFDNVATNLDSLSYS